MEDIIFSPELTVPDTLLLRNLADDIHRHQKLKGASSPDRDEGYSSTHSASQKPVVSAWIPCPKTHVVNSCCGSDG